jgi:hypothetical protein
MRFQIGNREYRVRWEFLANTKINGKRHRQTTRAIIEAKIPLNTGVGWTVQMSGMSHCNPKDRFDRVLGQRKALADALGPWDEKDPRYDNHMPAAARAIVWQEFERIQANAQAQQVQAIRMALGKSRELSEMALGRLLQDVVNEPAPGIAIDTETVPAGRLELPDAVLNLIGLKNVLPGGPDTSPESSPRPEIRWHSPREDALSENWPVLEPPREEEQSLLAALAEGVTLGESAARLPAGEYEIKPAREEVKDDDIPF